MLQLLEMGVQAVAEAIHHMPSSESELVKTEVRLVVNGAVSHNKLVAADAVAGDISDADLPEHLALIVFAIGLVSVLREREGEGPFEVEGEVEAVARLPTNNNDRGIARDFVELSDAEGLGGCEAPGVAGGEVHLAALEERSHALGEPGGEGFFLPGLRSVPLRPRTSVTTALRRVWLDALGRSLRVGACFCPEVVVTLQLLLILILTLLSVVALSALRHERPFASAQNTGCE